MAIFPLVMEENAVFFSMLRCDRMKNDGQAEIIVSGVKHEMNAGEMLLMPAHSPHSLKAIERFKMVLTMIKSQRCCMSALEIVKAKECL